MSKHENILNFAAAAVVPAQSLNTIGEIFRAWLQAFEAIQDTPTIGDDHARKAMQEMWNHANALVPKSSADVAAMYIMAERTVTADPDNFMEKAWSLVHLQSGDLELVKLYDVWRKLYVIYEKCDYGSDTDEALYKTICDLERKMAAIPASTAQGLAIKIDLGRFDEKGDIANGINADLARLTGYETRPEAHP